MQQIFHQCNDRILFFKFTYSTAWKLVISQQRATYNMILVQQYLYHPILPGNGTLLPIEIVLKCQSLFLGVFGVHVCSSNVTHVLQIERSPPSTWNDITILFFGVHQSVIEARVIQSYEVVKYNARHNDLLHVNDLLRQCGLEAAQSAGHDAKGIFNYPTPTGDAVVVYLLFSSEKLSWYRFHEPSA